MSLTWPRSRTLGTARDHAVRIVVALIVGKYEPNPGVEWRTQVVLRPVRHEPSGTSSKTAHCRRCSVPHNPAVDRDVREHLARGERYDEARIYGAILPNDVTLDDVIATAGGIDRPSQAWGTLLKSRIKTPDGRIDLAPPDYATDLPGALDGSIRTDDAFRFLLISGYRKLRSFNSWTTTCRAAPTSSMNPGHCSTPKRRLRSTSPTATWSKSPPAGDRCNSRPR